MAIRRFVSLDGNTQQIYYDNATTFIKACKELKNGIETTKRRIPFATPCYNSIWIGALSLHHRHILVVLERVW